MQFVHNHTILHDRTAFEDWPEPERKRHLLRLWLAAPGARPLPPVYAERYGSVEIGNRGGIICPGTRCTRRWSRLDFSIVGGRPANGNHDRSAPAHPVMVRAGAPSTPL